MARFNVQRRRNSSLPLSRISASVCTTTGSTSARLFLRSRVTFVVSLLQLEITYVNLGFHFLEQIVLGTG